MTAPVLRAVARVAAGIVLVFAFVLLIGAASVWVSPLAASLGGGLLLAAAAAWLAGRWGGPASPEGAPAEPAGPAPPAPSRVAPDVERVLAWCRTALAERVPAHGRFPPLTETLQPETRPLSGLAIRLTAEPFHGDDPADADLRILSIKVEAPGGSSIQTDVDLGTAKEVIARIDAGERTAWVTGLLERAGNEVWRGDDTPLSARVASVRAGTHAAPPQGPDCERYAADRMGDMDHETLLSSDRVSLWLRRCPECGQRFVEYWTEIWEDNWIFITRVSDEEAELIRRDYGWAPAILMSRRRITGSPGRGRRWEEEDVTELRMGPRG